MKPGERIKELRDSKGFGKNQKGFADIIGCSDAYLSEIERGVKEPSLKFLRIIEEKFNISPATILWGLSKDHWDAIKQIFQSEESPEGLFRKLASLLRPPAEGRAELRISEPPLRYERPEMRQEKRRPENAPLRAFIGNIVRILSSGNKKIIVALESNVEAFLENMELRKPERKEGD